MSVTYLTTPIVEVRIDPPPRGSGMTRDGYTKRSGAPTERMIRLQGEKRWRRLMIWQFSNLGTLFVNIDGKPHVVRQEDIPAEGTGRNPTSHSRMARTKKSPAQFDREIDQMLHAYKNGGTAHSTTRQGDEIYPTAEARRHVQAIQRREEFPEILAIQMRAGGTNYNVKVPDPKNKRGYDLVDVQVHHNGARSIKSASRSRTTPERASRIVSKYLEATRGT